MGDLFEKPERNFAPRTIWTGDNLDILRGLNSETVDLIYLDPPFSKNKTYAAPIGSKAAGAAFKDSWTLNDLDVAWIGMVADQHPGIHQVITAAGTAHSQGMMSYLVSMAVRLMEMRRLLKRSGTLWLHCDYTAGHYLKALLDCIFGADNFITEVAWFIGSRSGAIAKYKPGKAHETILVYATKYGEHTYNTQYLPYSESYLLWFKNTDEQGRKYRTRTRRGEVIRQYLDESPGVALHDTWVDISHLYTSSGWFPANRDEITGYPTQKPLALLNRIIKASSNPGDMVLDPFCGCATACVAADNLQREWVGIDISHKAVELVHMRLKDSLGALYHSGMVTARTDTPQRTDIEVPINYRKNRHVLFGEQEGRCNGCQTEFPFTGFAVDHIVARSRGGPDHKANLQLLCHHCNVNIRCTGV